MKVRLLQASTRCRCWRCGKRQTLPRHPEHYVKGYRLCKFCGKHKVVVDKYRNSGKEQKGKTCRCGEYSFPHTSGRGWCIHNAAKDNEREHREIWA
jgi:hypothetical protein